MAEGPLCGASRFLPLVAADGVRLRAAWRPAEGAVRGTALLLPGRTEFIEKYREVADRFAARGFAVAALDWRGQGGSARAAADGLLGHVDDFAEYQRDLDAFLAAAPVAEAPRPLVMVAHSMGGAIALRRALEQPDLAAAVIFSAPMWGLAQGRVTGWLGRRMARIACALGFSQRYIVGTGPRPYTEQGYEGNVLTSDRPAFEALAALTAENEALALGGPSWGWVRAAYREMDALALRAGPAAPFCALVGSDEVVVSPRAIHARAGEAALALANARHEPFIETPEIRDALWRGIDAFLQRARI